MKKHAGDIALIITALIWGFGFVCVKVALDQGLTPFSMMMIRFILSTVLLFALFSRQIRRIDFASFKAGCVMGVFYFLGYSLQTLGMHYTTPSKNAFITTLNVLIVPFLVWIIRKKRPETRTFFLAALALVGMAFLTLNEGMTGFSIGDGLTLLCAAFFAAHIVATGHFTQKHDVTHLVFGQQCASALLSILVFFAMGDHLLITTKGLIALLYLVIMSTTIAALTQSYGQKHTSPARASIILSLESVFGVIFSVIIYHEHINAQMFIGCFIMLLAVILSELPLLSNKRRKWNNEKQAI